MAQYHKIPQNVTTYEGRIIGKFTAKQFIFLAVGGIAIFLIVNSTLQTNIKLVISGIIGFITAILALANVDGRSSDFWVSTFLHVVYLPTQRMWQKTSAIPRFMLPQYHPPHKKLGPRKRTMVELNELIGIWRPVDSKISQLTEKEQATLMRIRSYKSTLKENDVRANEVVAKLQNQTKPTKTDGQQ